MLYFIISGSPDCLQPLAAPASDHNNVTVIFELLGASLDLVVLRLQRHRLVVQLFGLGAEGLAVYHLVLLLPLPFLLARVWSVGLDQIPPEDRVEAVGEQGIVAEGLELAQVRAQVLLQLEVLLPLRVLEPADDLGLADDARFLLLAYLLCLLALLLLEPLGQARRLILIHHL